MPHCMLLPRGRLDNARSRTVFRSDARSVSNDVHGAAEEPFGVRESPFTVRKIRVWLYIIRTIDRFIALLRGEEVRAIL